MLLSLNVLALLPLRYVSVLITTMFAQTDRIVMQLKLRVWTGLTLLVKVLLHFFCFFIFWVNLLSNVNETVYLLGQFELNNISDTVGLECLVLSPDQASRNTCCPSDVHSVENSNREWEWCELGDFISWHEMFLQRKQAIENDNAVTDGNLVTLYHGTKPRNIMGIASEGFNRNYGRSSMYTPFFSVIKMLYICDNVCLERRVIILGGVLFLGGSPHPTQ